MSSPYQVTKQLEDGLCEYTGARYAVALNSGTAAIMLALKWYAWAIAEHKTRSFIWGNTYSVEIPKRTYVSVACAIRMAGGGIKWRDEDWIGEYQIRPSPVWDSARRFTSGMYKRGQFQCLSFATNKILGIEQGGAILHENAAADAWFRRMRFDGRTEGVDPLDDHFDVVGHHCIMLPSIAAQLVLKLHHLPKHNEDMPYYEYPDLSQHPAFGGTKVKQPRVGITEEGVE